MIVPGAPGIGGINPKPAAMIRQVYEGLTKVQDQERFLDPANVDPLPTSLTSEYFSPEMVKLLVENSRMLG